MPDKMLCSRDTFGIRKPLLDLLFGFHFVLIDYFPW